MNNEKLPDAIDLSHHLSRLSQARVVSPLKMLQKFKDVPGLISLAGGLPNPQYFPFASLSTQVLAPDYFSSPASRDQHSSLSWLRNWFSKPKERRIQITIPKYPDTPGQINLASALQYGLPSGLTQLQDIIKEFTLKVYRPAYADFHTLLHIGNTDGWLKIVMTLCNPGDTVLACEWTYPSAMTAMFPFGLKAIPISMDGQGMSSQDLRKVLSEWDIAGRGAPRPRVMYTVPIGQNPTGATMGAQRKREIYSICVEFDVIIVEDDPYFFLQEGTYQLPSERERAPHRVAPSPELVAEQFVSQLEPSYLKFDYQGRVVRLDSFSKTIAPGCRMGWFTCNPKFAERLERQSETATQGPSGFAQALVTSLLINWGSKGYIEWLSGLRAQYILRRDFFIDCLDEEFHLDRSYATEGVWVGCDIFSASQKLVHNEESPSVKNTLFSFVPPTSGMFVWLKFNFNQHPYFPSLGYKALETKLWTKLGEAGVLLGPGSLFAANPSTDSFEGPGHFRISFSDAEFDNMKKAVSIFASVLHDFCRDP